MAFKNASFPLVSCSVVQLLSHIWLCDPMDYSMPDFHVHHQLLELAQTHVQCFSDAIQSSPSLLPLVFPSIRVFSNESALRIRWPKYWSFSFSISPSSEYSGLISFRIDWLDLLTVQGLSRVFSSTTIGKNKFFGVQPLRSNSPICICPLEKP